MRLSMFRMCALLLLLIGAGCSNALDDFPTTPDPVIVTETFSGTITVNGAATHSIFTSTTGTVTATIVSLGENPPERVGLSLGTLSTNACTVVVSNDNAVNTTVLGGTVTSLGGSLCVRIYDVGSLTGPIPYEIRVEHP